MNHCRAVGIKIYFSSSPSWRFQLLPWNEAERLNEEVVGLVPGGVKVKVNVTPDRKLLVWTEGSSLP